MNSRHYHPSAVRLLPGSLILIALFAAFAVLAAADTSAATRYVAPAGSDAGGANDCTIAAAPCATIRHALARSAAGDTIRLGTGAYAESVLHIPHALTLLGDGPAAVSLDGGATGSVIVIDPGASAVVVGVTIRGGASDRGGAIRVEAGGTLVLRRAALESNRADWGGGIYMAGGSATIEDSRLSGNTAAMGGAIYVEGGALAVSASEIIANEATSGGGLALGSGATAALHRVTLSGNTAATVGGGINSAGALSLGNSVLDGNRAVSRGGGLFNDTGTAAIDYTTWLDNRAAAGAALAGSGATRVSFSVLSESGRACDTAISGAFNRLDDDSCGQPVLPATGLLPGGRPAHGSNAIDAGPVGICAADAATLTTDARGEPRPADGDRDGSARCDLGAFEFQPRLAVIHNPSLADDTRFAFLGDLGEFTLEGRSQPRQVFEAAPGSYRLEQSREPGWKLTTIVCDGDSDGGTTVDAAARAAVIDLDPAEAITCTFTSRANRDSIGIALRAPGSGDAVVTFGGGAGAFELRSASQPDMRSGRLAPGLYPVQATTPAGWRVAAISCLGDRDLGSTTDPAAGLAVVDLDAKETIGCTFTLAPVAAATLTIRHETAPAGSADDAPVTYTGDLGVFALRSQSAATRVFTPAPGQYTIHELLHPQWALSSLSCAGDTDGGTTLLPEEMSAVIDLDAGEAITCTFSHVRAAAGAGAITISQAADPADGTSFGFTGALGEFSLQPPGAAARTWAGLNPGSYSVRQLLPAGWVLGSITCTGDTDNGGAVLPAEAQAIIDLDEGEAISCVFANSRPSSAAAITIIHEADPANDLSFRYLGTLGGFNLLAPSRPGRTFSDLPPGLYTVYFRAVDGWTLGGLMCEGDSDGGSVLDVAVGTAAIDLDAGEAIVCRFQHLGPGVTPQPTPQPTPGPSPTPPPGANHRLYLPFAQR